MIPGCAKMRPTQTEPHIIPYDTDVVPPDTELYCGSPFNIPLLHRYNTGVRCLKGHNLMSNYVTTVSTSRQVEIPESTNTTEHHKGEYWSHTDVLQEIV